MIKGLCLCFSVLLSAAVSAQKNDAKPLRPVTAATTVSIGGGKIYDTYLSPVKYGGQSFGIHHERMRVSRFGGNRLTSQHLLSAEAEHAENPAGNHTMWGASFDYTYGMFYRFSSGVSDLNVLAGAQLDSRFGVAYNAHNSNNPANAKGDINFQLSGMAIYRWSIKGFPVTLRYQASVAMAGVFFCPEYGQSYYEIFSLGDTGGIVHFGSLHNQFNMQNLLTVDIPVNTWFVRIGYRNDIRTFRENHLRSQIYTNSFVVGMSKEFRLLRKKGKVADKNRTVLSAYY